MEAFRQLVITSEQEAFDALSAALDNTIGDEPLQIKFDRWPLVEIRLEGPGYESTITPDMAAALIELQSAMNRAYARTVHHSGNARTLTAEERKSLQFKAKVDKGSSLITIDLGDFAEKIGLEMIGRMEPTQLVITVLGLAAAGGSLLAYKAFLKYRTEDKRIEAEAQRSIAFTQEETRRLDIFSRAVSAQPNLRAAQEDFDVARHEIVRGTSDANSLTVNSVMLDRDSAHVVASTPRSQSRELQLNGDYFILEANWKEKNCVKLKLRNLQTNQEFVAILQDDSFNGDQLAALQEAEWNRAKVFMSINATELRGTITSATIVGVKVQPGASKA